MNGSQNKVTPISSLSSILALPLVLASLVGCSSGRSTPAGTAAGSPADTTKHFGAQGTVDGGGGDGIVRQSTLSQVKNAFQEVVMEVLPYSFRNHLVTMGGSGPLGSAFGTDWMFSSNPQTKIALKLFHELSYEHFKRLSETRRIELDEIGPCHRSDGGHADGSVSGFNLSSKICISANRMQRFPPGELIPQIAALIVHEMAHQYGLDETIAITIQDRYLKSFEAKPLYSQDLASRRRRLYETASENISFYGERLSRLAEIQAELSLSRQHCDPNQDELEIYFAGQGRRKLKMSFYLNPSVLNGEDLLFDISEVAKLLGDPVLVTNFQKLVANEVPGFSSSSIRLTDEMKHACDADIGILLRHHLLKMQMIRDGVVSLLEN